METTKMSMVLTAKRQGGHGPPRLQVRTLECLYPSESSESKKSLATRYLRKELEAFNLVAMASTLVTSSDGLQPNSDGLLMAMAFTLVAMAFTLVSMAFTLAAMASNLIARPTHYLGKELEASNSKP